MTKAEKEKSIFLEFIRRSPYRNEVVEKTIENCVPPEPDIACIFKDGTRHYFELFQVIDQESKRGLEKYNKFPAIFQNQLKKIEPSKRQKFKELYNDTKISIKFDSTLTDKKLENKIDKIIDFLNTLDDKVEGKIIPIELEKEIKYIRIRRPYGGI